MLALLCVLNRRIRQIQTKLVLEFHALEEPSTISSEERKKPRWVVLCSGHKYVHKQDFVLIRPNERRLNVNVCFGVKGGLFPQVYGDIPCKNPGLHPRYRLAGLLSRRRFMAIRMGHGPLRHSSGCRFKRRRRTSKRR